jgi:hypothetical protein
VLEAAGSHPRQGAAVLLVGTPVKLDSNIKSYMWTFCYNRLVLKHEFMSCHPKDGNSFLLRPYHGEHAWAESPGYPGSYIVLQRVLRKRGVYVNLK